MGNCDECIRTCTFMQPFRLSDWPAGSCSWHCKKNHRRRKQIVSGEVGAGRLIWKLEKQQKSTRTIMLNIGRCVLSDFLMKKVTRFRIINLRRNWFCPCEFLCWNRSICQRRNLRGFFFLFHLFQLYFFDRCMYVSATDRQNVCETRQCMI